MTRSKDFTCAQIVELATDYVEGTLGPRDREQFEAHLAYCEPCRVYLDQMRRTIEVTGMLRAEDLARETQAALVAAFRDWRQA